MPLIGFEYVPPRLPHCEGYVDALIRYLKMVIDRSGVMHACINERILITGGSGTRKTVTAKRGGVELVYAHVNCRASSGEFGLVLRPRSKPRSKSLFFT